MIVSYFVVYFLIPKYLLTKKYRLFALYSFYTLVISTYLIVLAVFGSYIFLANFDMSDIPLMSRNFEFVLILVWLIVAVLSFISILNHNFKNVSRYKELQNKILETQLQLKDQELQHLKKQIHPHFLFNTLNTIYGFAIKQSKNTAPVILKLSNLLDYILYQVNKPKVSLKEEILHINEYIELERIRFRDTLQVNFTYDEIDEKVQIAPMLLIPFVENAFKHGKLSEGILSINANLTLKKDQLNFSIRNTAHNLHNGEESTGIGLVNIKKRLDLLYADKFSLKIENVNNWFSVELIIPNINHTTHV
jgi:two-component system LytT family sensor kinase